MAEPKFLNKKPRIVIYGLITLLLFVVFHHQLFQFSNYLFTKYLALIENVSNYFLHVLQSGAEIKDHHLRFEKNSLYVDINKDIIDNWKDYVLFKKWTFSLLVLFWVTISPVREKIIYTFILLIAHFISVISGVLIIGSFGPVFVNSNTLSELRPNFFGALAMLTVLTIWIKNNLPGLFKSLRKIKIDLKLSRKKISNILVLFFMFSILKNFIVPYFNFKHYIHFLLLITKSIVSLFGYSADIVGPYLIGGDGTLFMAKWCLGFITMFIFSAFIYLIGKDKRTNVIYILSGIVFLHILNVLRLATLFIFVQNNPDLEAAYNHHMIYNIIVYLIIFVVWIIFIEKYSGIRKQSVENDQLPH